MAISDWLYLPEFAEKFDAVVESKTVGANKLPRLVFIKNFDGLAYVYVADLATGKRQGDRLNLVTYFKDKPTTLIDNLNKNGVKKEDAESVLNALFFDDKSPLSQAYPQHSTEGGGSDQLATSDENIPQPTENAIEPDQLAAEIDGNAMQVSPETEELTPDGLDNEVKTAKGTKIVTGFMVVEASKLIISHDEQGNANPDYPAELQPRDRSRDTSQLQITKIANNLDPDMLGRTRVAYQGAPIVGKDGVVESGNGRAMGITLAYKLGKADEYRAWLLEVADMYGLSETKINAMKRPVLVRVRKTDIDRVQFAMESNQSDMLAMTGTEKAKSDANRLTDAIISKLSIDGDLTAASNRDFIAAFLQALGDDETAGLLTTSGQPTKQLYDRAQAAIFAKAYNDDRLLELMADDSKPEIGNIIKSLNQAARPFIRALAISDKVTHDTTQQIGDAIQVSLDQQAVDAIVKATEMLKKAKDSGMPIEELVKQGDLFGDTDPVVAQMALFIKDNNRSAARMGVAFEEMANFVLAELENRQNNSLFVDEPEINMVDVLKAANAKLQKQYGSDVKDIGGTGGFIDIFTETRGQKADREAFLQNQDEQVQSSRVPSNAPVLKVAKKAIGDIKEMRQQAKEYAKNNFAGQSVYSLSMDKDIVISMSGIKHTLASNSGEELVNSIFITPEIIKNGIYLGKEPDRKGNESVIAHHYLGIKLDFDGVIKDVVVDVREVSDGHFYYDHSFEKANADATTPLSKTGIAPAPEPEGSDISIAQPDKKASIDDPSNKTTSTEPEMPNFNNAIDELEKLIGKDEYDDTIDALIEQIDQAGVMAEYEPRLLELDRLHANEITKGV